MVALGVLLLCGGPLFASEGNVSSDATHKVVALQHITAERGRDFLTRLGIATASKLPGAESLLITGNKSDLQKAQAVLELVDSRTEYDVRDLGATFASLPASAEIARAVGSVCVGTFANPPRDRSLMRAIVDVHNGRVLIISPVIQIQDIRIAVELGPAVVRERRTVASPEKTGVSTIQASSMLESSLGSEADPIEAGSAQPRAAASTQKMQELRRRAAEIEALRRANLAQAASAAVPADGNAVAGNSEANGVSASVPSELGHAGAASDANAVVENLPVARPATPDSPFNADRITSPQIEPKSLMDGAAIPATETMSSSLSPTSIYEPAAIPDGDTYVTLNLQGPVPLIDLLDLVGKYLNLSYLYDPAAVSGDVSLKLNGSLKGQVKKKDLYPLIEAVLQDKDLVMTRHKGNIIRILRKVDALKADPELMTPGCDPLQAGNAVISKMFELKYIDNASADNLLQNMDLAIRVTSIAQSRTMIVTAYAHRMARIQRLLEMVDRPGAPRKFKYRQLRYTMAKALAEKVKALAEQMESMTVTVGAAEEPQVTPAKLPNETEAAYRTRLTAARAAEAARRAQAVAKGQPAQEGKQGVYLDADERTNRILMIGEADQLAMVEELVDELDVAQQDLRALQLYRMKYVDADEVARKLQELGIIRKMPETTSSQRQAQNASRITSPAAAQARNAGATAADAATTPTGTELTEEGLVGEPQVVVVESTNSLLVNGTPEQHAKICSIIEYVDREMDLEEIPYKIYALENSSPAHLAGILQDLIEESTEQTQDKDGKIEKVVTKRKDEIAIVPDPNTYSVIVYASKKNQEWIQTLIKQLDKRRPQVLIDVTLVEVTKTEAFNYDLDLVQSATNLSSTSGLIKSLSSTQPDNYFREVKSDSGTFTGYYGDSHINALLTAMQSKNYGRVLAKPKILVNDNEPGLIKTADTTYVKKTSSIPVTSGAAGTDSTLIQTSTDYTPYDAGIELNITPHIAEGDLLRLDIALTRSDFRETKAQDSPPDTTSSQVTTGVTVPDGSTIILGGMVKLNQNKGGTKVPLLGDIPLVGGLFRSIKNADTESKLYVFVKAEVIRPDLAVGQGMKDLTEISDKHRMAFERSEHEFQSYQDWPGIKSKPVAPAKVLEVQ